MTDKQMKEKKKEFRELEVQLHREMKENAKVTGVHDLDELDEKKWQWISKLVEEVERETKEIDRKLMEKVADSDYQFGFIRGTQTSESLTPLRISEHEEERKKIRKEMMERFYN